MNRLSGSIIVFFLFATTASGSGKSAHRLAMRRYATIGTIQESERSVGVIKDLSTGKTFYLREGARLPGNRSFFVQKIQGRQIMIATVGNSKSFALPEYTILIADLKFNRDEIDPGIFREIILGCREDAQKYCDQNEADISVTFQCLKNNFGTLLPACATMLEENLHYSADKR